MEIQGLNPAETKAFIQNISQNLSDSENKLTEELKKENAELQAQNNA